MFSKLNLLILTLLAMIYGSSAGLQGVPSKSIDMEELERAVESMNELELKDDMLEIKVLHERVEKFRTEGKYDEAESLQRRVHKKMENLQYDMSNKGRDPMDIPQDINARVRDRDQRFRDRDEMRRERDEHFRKRMAERGHVLPEDMEGEFDAHDLHEEMMKRHRERDGATLARKDITERHKELIDHRQRDITDKIEKAGFSPEEEEKLKKDLEEYLRIETEVMESRASDRSKSRDRKEPKSKEERMQERDEMKNRRDHERKRMEEAREKRKNIDSMIREKMAANQDL